MGAALDFLQSPDPPPGQTLGDLIVPNRKTDAIDQFLDGRSAKSYGSELPPGFTLQPPAASPDAIDRFLNAKPQMTGTAREIALPASEFAKGAITAGGAPGDYQRIINSLLVTPALRALFGRAPSASLPTAWPTSDQALSQARNWGIVDRPDLQPQNERERLEAQAAQGAGSALPFLPLAGPGALLAGAGSGAGSYGGEKLTPDNPWIGSMIGGVAGGLLTGPLSTLANRGTNLILGNLSDMGQAYRTAGVPVRMTGDISENPALQAVQSLAMKMPGGASRTQRAAQATVDALGQSVEDTAGSLGGATTEQQAGNALQNAARGWVNNVFPTRQAQAWAPVDQAMSGADVPLTNYRQALGDLQARLGRLQESGKALGGAELQHLTDAINTDLPANAPASWEEAQNLRNAIGDAMGTPSIADSIGQARLSRLYGALSDDMRGATTNVSPDIANAFDAANAVSTSGYAFRNGPLSRIISAKNPSLETITPERATQNVLNADGTTMGALRSELPNAVDTLGGYKLRDMALATPGQQNAAGTAISPNSFLTDWNRLSPEQKSALYPHPEIQQRIDALAKVSQGIRETAKGLNHSNTAPTLAFWNAIREPFELGTAAAVGAHEIGGFPGIGTAATAIGAAASPFVAGAFASRIAANRLLANLLAARGIGLPGQGALIGASEGFNRNPPMLLGAPEPALLGKPQQEPAVLGAYH